VGGKDLNTLDAHYFQAQVPPVQGKCATHQKTSHFEKGKQLDPAVVACLSGEATRFKGW